VAQEGGSGYIRNGVLRAALEGERRMVLAGQPGKSLLTGENYESAVGEMPGEEGVLALQARPRRKDVLFVDGTLFISAADADLVRVEGRLSKSPSVWTREVRVVRTNSRIAGVRVPTRLDSVASVRIAGTSTFSMVYQYEMVNGADVAAP
jgi:hypothetical protein